LCFGHECTIYGYRSCKKGSHQIHAFYSHEPKMMFGSVLEHFENLRNVRSCKTYVLGMNALFWGTELAKMVSHQMHQLYCLGPKMFFGSVFKHFINLLHVKRKKTCVSVTNLLFRGTEVAKIVSHQMHSF
jgi:hypothetical protein